MIDFDKPVRAIMDATIGLTAPVEILRANLIPPYIAVGLVFFDRADGKKGKEAVVMLFNVEGVAENGTQIENFEPIPAAYTPRSLRVGEAGREFIAKSGHVAKFLGPNGVDLDWEINYDFKGNTGPLTVKRGYVTTDAAGRVVAPRPRNADELDIVEVSTPVTRYVRIFDKPKTAKNPSCCSNWYEFDSLAEAQANMQGVRAIATITYAEGDNFP